MSTIHDLIKVYLNHLQSANQSHCEFEVRLNEDKLNKQSFDSIYRELCKHGFKVSTKEYQMKIIPEKSKLRVELNSLSDIQMLCRTNDFPSNALFVEKKSLLSDTRPVVNYDFGFRTSIQKEQSYTLNDTNAIQLKKNWFKSKKLFRYLYRTSLIHEKFPYFRIDMSVVRSNKMKSYRDETNRTRKKHILCAQFLESNLLNEHPSYEVEIECINVMKDAVTNKSSLPELKRDIETQLKKIIKYSIGAIQRTPFPVPYPELKTVFHNYTKVLKYLNENREPRKPYFIGPSSLTLQKENFVEGSGAVNVTTDFCVTDKADGDRKLLFIFNQKKLYFVDMNLNVQFTGLVLEKEIQKPILIDGEHLTINKQGEVINKFVAFDIYCKQGKNCMGKPFIEDRSEKNKRKNPDDSRYFKLIQTIQEINENLLATLKPSGNIENGEINDDYEEYKKKGILELSVKPFFVSNEKHSIYEKCGSLLEHINGDQYNYNTDGMIFTSKYDIVPVNGRKVTWEKSFKWKPPEYNTIDFLIRIKKNSIGEKIIETKKYKGKLVEYHIVELFVGFNENQHGFAEPQKMLLDMDYGTNKKKKPFGLYYAKRFSPTNPTVSNAYICHLHIAKDSDGQDALYTIEKDAIEDDSIVEFSYNMDEHEQYEKWVPLRVRYDKTHDYKLNKSNFGNAHHVANNNWKNIHDPISEGMLTNKEIIQLSDEDESVYYNRKQTTSHTNGLRNFHNLYVKMKLIESVSNPNDDLIDLAVGKAGDLSKWIKCKLHGVLGIDISKDNIHNTKDGACSRYIQMVNKKKTEELPISMFIQGDTSKLIENGDFDVVADVPLFLNNMILRKDEWSSHGILGVLMGVNDIRVDSVEMPLFLRKQYGLFKDKFNICSIQFALHYMFESKSTLHAFLTNVSKYTKKGGYFIGTCYDGKKIYSKLKTEEKIELWSNNRKIWQVKKKYEDDQDAFLINDSDENTKLGYTISVYQETINKEFDEYLVNFDYFVKVMNDYGFEIQKDKMNGLQSFQTLYDEMMTLNESEQTQYGMANKMSPQEKEISFLNNYFIFQKTRDNIRSLYTEEVAIDYSVGKPKKLNKSITLV
mgnify:CR=1 FL=1